MIRAVAAEGSDAVVVLCTNMDGAAITAALERELDVLILRFRRSHAVANDVAGGRRPENIVRLGADLSAPGSPDVTEALRGTV